MTLKIELPLLVTGAIVTTVLSVIIWKLRSSKRVYVKVGKVQKLFYYPIKSLKGMEVPEIVCSNVAVKSGGLWDRSFMLVSGDHVLVSQRQEPRMILLGISVSENNVIVIRSSEGKTLKVKTKDIIDEHDIIINCKVHDYAVPTVDCGDEAAKFFQDFLGRDDVRLVQFMHMLPSRRYTGEDPFRINILPDKLALQDFAPLNILSQSSIDALNTKLEKKVSLYNFRPNVLVEGAEPYDEDTWANIKFSSGAVIDKVVPCTRCVLTTNDPETGIKTDKEPLLTLKKFRMLKDKKLAKSLRHAPAFGIWCFPSGQGKISVGDDVYAVIEKRTIVISN